MGGGPEQRYAGGCSLTPGPRADEILKLALFPWIAAVVVDKVVPIVQAYEGSKAAKALQHRVERTMEEVMAGVGNGNGANNLTANGKGCANGSNGVNRNNGTVSTLGLIAAMSHVGIDA